MASAAKVPFVVFLIEKGNLSRFARLLPEVLFVILSFSVAWVFVVILRWENFFTRLTLKTFLRTVNERRRR